MQKTAITCQAKIIIIRQADSGLMPEYLKDYIKTGGISEYALNGNIEYLKKLVDDIL